MSKLELQLTNGGMRLNIVALIGDKALLQRLNDNSFIVVNGLNIHNDFTCEWDFAYGYVESYDRAYKLFNDKVTKEWLEYGNDTTVKEVLNDILSIANNLSYSHGISLDDRHDAEQIVSKARDLLERV